MVEGLHIEETTMRLKGGSARVEQLVNTQTNHDPHACNPQKHASNAQKQACNPRNKHTHPSKLGVVPRMSISSLMSSSPVSAPGRGCMRSAFRLPIVDRGSAAAVMCNSVNVSVCVCVLQGRWLHDICFQADA